MLHSVEDILKREFGCSISDENVHILDPFVGTGTFVTRLLQSGLIRPEDMERKYRDEIHCNELVLLAYYIADVNIESVFHEVTGRKEYLRYEGICMTDTFNLNEHGENDIFSLLFKENSDRLNKQKKAPVRVIIGNPPYSVGQRSANDNAPNLEYPKLDSRVEETYAKNSTANLRKGLYDYYIKAFRWAADRISAHDKGGVIAFISNGAWLDGQGHDGFRKCLEEEFSAIYVMNLRGNQRTSGELSRKEGGKIFGSGSRTPICMTLLVKKPEHQGKARIHYYDIGDYLSREEKLKRIKNFKSIRSDEIEWKAIHPNEKRDWINQRDGLFDTLLPLFPPKKFDLNAHSFFSAYSLGVATNRDSWIYNSSLNAVTDNMQRMIAFYNEQQKAYSKEISDNNLLKVEDFINRDSKKISWTVNLKNDLENGVVHKEDQKDTRVVMYRPFYQQCIYFDVNFIERPGQSKKFFPTPRHENRVICVSGIGSKKEFSAMITDCIPDLQVLFNGQCFPLYWYEEKDTAEPLLFEMGREEKYSRKEGVTDWILKEVCSRYGVKKGELTREHIFYYVYGLLHSAQYRKRFADDLRKSLPRIPIVEKLEDFLEFQKKGKELADLHLNYEALEPCRGVQVLGAREPEDVYEFYRVEKMRFPAREQKEMIIYNDELRIENIPAKAYQYVVNGKSAIEWIMESYQVTVDKKSQIKNDPNDWSREHGQPRYILDLLLSVIHLSVKSVEIMESLPKLTFEDPSADSQES
jgi:predicted helicase